MKYLIIAAIIAFAFVILYSRLRPYLQLIQKVVSTLNAQTPTGANARSSSDNRLVRCAGCGTWIPADRALTLKSGLVTFCSSDCLEKKPAKKEKKRAG